MNIICATYDANAIIKYSVIENGQRIRFTRHRELVHWLNLKYGSGNYVLKFTNAN